MSTMTVRRPVVAGNWKMNAVPSRAAALADEVLQALPEEALAAVEVVLCPPSIALPAVSGAVTGHCAVGAQNMHWEAAGAFTGEISGPMVAELCSHVILGHSERRQYFGESDATVQLKVRAALRFGLQPIICVGESQAQRAEGRTHTLISSQVLAAIMDCSADEIGGLIVAYEPIWAIGTGLAASSSDAQEVAALIREVLHGRAGEHADEVRILYGGSVTGSNAADFFQQPDIDGALVGGASLKPADFARIVEAAVARTAQSPSTIA